MARLRPTGQSLEASFWLMPYRENHLNGALVKISNNLREVPILRFQASTIRLSPSFYGCLARIPPNTEITEKLE